MAKRIASGEPDSAHPSAPGGFENFLEDDGFDLRHYWRVAQHYKWGIVGLTFAVGLFTTVWTSSLQPVYRSSATLMIGGTDIVNVSGQVDSTERLYNTQFLYTQLELLKSREVARAVLEKLGGRQASILDRIASEQSRRFDWRKWVPQSWLGAKRAGSTEPDAQSDPDKLLLRWLGNGLSLQPVRETSVVHVSFDATDPELAATIANAFTQAYLDNNLKQRKESATAALLWLQAQVEKSRQYVLESAGILQKYREEAGLVNTEGLRSVQTEQLKDRTDSLSVAQRVLNEAESLYLRAKSLQAEQQLDDITQVRENGRIQSLRAEEQRLERQIRADLEHYTNDYPGLDAARNDLKAIRDEIDEALGNIVAGFKTDYEIAKNRVTQLEREVQTLEASVQELGRKQLESEALEQTVTTNRQSYEAFLKQLMDTSTRSADTVSMIARVIDPAVPATVPIKPNKRRLVTMGILFALMGGLGIAFMLDKLDNSLKHRDDVVERLGIPVLGELLLLKKKRADGAPMVPPKEFVDEPGSAFAEEIRTIRTSVALTGLDQSRQVLVITSTVSGEGKSTVALNLALALGQLGNVLLIDCDLRRPSMARLFGQDGKAPGLTDLVAGTAKVADCVRAVTGGIHVMLAGSTTPPDPLKILASPQFSRVLENAAAIYDSVVIDSAPVELVSDARVLATMATGVIYVIKADHTSHQSVRQGLGALSEKGAPLLGAVLNQVDTKRLQAYGSYKYSYSGYGRSGAHPYGQGAEPSKSETSAATRKAS